MLKNIVTFCDFMGSQMLCIYLKNRRRVEMKSTNDCTYKFPKYKPPAVELGGFFPFCDIACKDLSKCCLQV